MPFHLFTEVAQRENLEIFLRMSSHFYVKLIFSFRFEEKSHTFEQLDLQLRKLHFATESLAEYRRNLAISTGNISRSLAVLSGSEENSALSGAIAQLSTVQEKIEQIHYEQATADFYYLSELIKDYIGLVGAVKDVFQVIKGGTFLEVIIFWINLDHI